MQNINEKHVGFPESLQKADVLGRNAVMTWDTNPD